MEKYSQIYSPVQNMAIWIGAWLYGHESYDDLDEVLYYLGASVDFDVLKIIRSHVQPLLHEEDPVIRLILSGPGHPPALPQGPAAHMAMESGAILFRGLRPETGKQSYLVLGLQGELFDVGDEVPSSAYITSGHAERMLTQAVSQAIEFIDESVDMPHARMRIGYLSDHYETPGLPAYIPERPAKLLARTDRITAILEASEYKVSQSVLIGLWRYIRQARMSAVENIMSEWAAQRNAVS